VDATDAAIWTLRRPDGTVAGYFGACGASMRAVEKAARDDYRRRATADFIVIGPVDGVTASAVFLYRACVSK
jgi:hypothetical protein